MPLYGKIVVIKRNGTDGTHFPLTASSCLFGRKKECDIRIQIPLVSKEHCKIEVNENKEATLFNLSSATPTQLNGINVQDPTYLKHGDVLTIIDRSFRFEYPPLSPPRKRISRSQEKETLQVLHVQQEEQESLHSLDSENRNSQISEKKHECGSETLVSEKKRTKEHTGQYSTYEFPYKIHQPERKDEMSPFSKLYELMKYEGSAKNTEENAISTPRKGYSPPEYGNSIPQAASQVPARCSVDNQTKSEAEILNGVSHSGNIKSQEVNSVSNLVCFDKNSSRRSSGRRLAKSIQSYATKQKEGGEDANQLNICNKVVVVEENELEKSKVINSANKVFRATRSTKYFPQPCCIITLDSTDTTKYIKPEKADINMEAKVTDTAESDDSDLLTPKSKRENFQPHPNLYTRNARSPSKFRMQQEELDSLIEMKSYSENSSKTEKYSVHACMEGHESDNTVENSYPKVMECNTEMTTEQINAQEETKTETSESHISKDRNSRMVASPHHSNKSRSPRMNTEQNKGSPNRSSFIKLTTEELFVIPADSCTGRITPVKMDDASVGRDWLQEEEDKIKQQTTKDHDQNVDTKNNAAVSFNLSETDHDNGVVVPSEPVSESNMSSPLITKSEIKKSPQKRKSRQLLTQPLGKRKRVSFGGHLSPELFDKRLPPNSPLKKGAIPARLSLPFGNSPRAVLKKVAGLRQFVTKEQHKTNLMKMSASPPARRSPSASPPARRSPSASPPARRSPSASPLARRSPSASPPARRSPSASPPARRSPTASPLARRSPSASSLARRSPSASPSARRSPSASPPARRSPSASPPARRSPSASPLARRSPSASPPARRSPSASPPARKSLSASSPARKSLSASSPACRSPTASPLARRSPSASPSARRSPSASTPACRSPSASTPARRSPSASPPACRSPSASPPAILSSNIVQRKGRFSVTHVTCPSSEEQDPIAMHCHLNEEFAEVKTPHSPDPLSKAASSVRRSKNFAPKRSSLRRSGTMNLIHSKRRSGASEANLMVAKSWAEVVKQGVPKSQIKTNKTCGIKRKAPKKIPTKPSKNNVSMLKTPIRKIKGHFTTGHANSPAPILIGKAHSNTMNLAAQVPKVMFNYPLKQQHNLNESFTGMAEMFKTPMKGEERSSLSSGQKTTPDIISEMHSSGESGTASTTPSSISNQLRLCSQDIVSPPLNEMPQASSLGQDDLQITPREISSSLKVAVRKNSSPVAIDETAVVEDKNPAVEDNKLEVTEELPAVKRILRTPKQKTETVKVVSGLRRCLRTPKQKTEPVEALSGVKRILRTPKQKMEPVEALSGVKRILRTPKQKTEPVDALSGVKRILRTPKQKMEPVEVFSGIKTIFRTPKQKMEPDGALSGIKGIFRTPKQETEPTEVFSDINRLLRTPKENLDPVADDIVCSKLIKTPEALMGSFKKKQIIQPPKDHADEIPKEKVITLEDMEGMQRQLRTPVQSSEPIDLVGISQLFKTPRQKFLPVDDYFGLQKLMAEPKQTCLSPEIDYTGLKEMLSPTDQNEDEILQSAYIMEEDNGPCINSRNKLEPLENESGSKEAKLEASSEIKIPFTILTKDNKCDAKLEDNPLNKLKIEATETECVPESCQPDDTESQNGDKTDFVKESSANLGPKDKEMAVPLALSRTRRRKVDESTPIEQTRKVQKHTRNLHRAKSDKSVKSNDGFEQSNSESSAYESPMPIIESVTTISSREESSKLSIETSSNMENNDFETSVVEIIGNSISKRNTRGKAIPVKTEIKTSEIESTGNSRSKRNTRGKAIPVKTENKTSEIESIGNSIYKRNTRGKAIPLKTEIEILNTTNEYESGSKKFTSKICKIEALESNIAEVQENAVRRAKGKKVTFLLEKNNSMSLADKCVLGDNSIIPEEERSSFSESSTSSAKENTSRRSKKKVSVVSQQLCFSLSEEKDTLEICGNKGKKGIKSSFEDIILTKDDPLVVSSSFFQGKTVPEIQVEESPNETQNVSLENSQTPAVHSPLKKQDVAEENLPRRGQNRQIISHEICTEYDSKQSSDMKKQNVVFASEEKQPKRGRGRRAVPAFQIPLPLESITLAKKSPKTDHISSSQTECSLQQIQKEENTNETLKDPVESMQTSTERHPARSRKAAKENPLRTGRSKQGIAHETSTEYDNKKATEVIDCNVGVAINENQQKRVRRKRGLPVLQDESLTKESPTPFSFSSAKGDESLQQIQNEDLPSESQKVSREVVQTPAEHSPPKKQKEAKEYRLRRGRRKDFISHETSTEFSSKQAIEIIEHGIDLIKERNQPKRGKAVPVLQTPLLRENTAFAKEDPKTDSFNSAQGECSLQQIPNEANVCETQEMPMESAEHSPPKRFKIAQEDPPRRGRRKAAYQETLTECEKKQATVLKDENTVVRNADSAKKNESKRGRRRKIVPASQESPLKNNNLILLPTIKSKSEVEQPSSVWETAATASESLPRKSSRKKDDRTATGSVPANDKSKLLDNGKEEKMLEDVKDLREESVPKRGRRRQLVHEISSNNQLGNSENTISINDKTVHFERDFEKKTRSKRNKEKENVLVSELLPSLKVSITLPSSSSDKGRTANENQSTLVENVGKGKRAKYGRNNNKIMECATSVKRNNKHTLEVFQEKDLEKTTLANDKPYRRGRKIGDVFESTIAVSLKAKDRLTASTCSASEDQQEVLDNQSITFHKDKNSDSEFTTQEANKNSIRMGRRKQERNGSETSDIFAENKSKSKKEKAESTTLTKGKKMKDHTTAVIEPTTESEGRTRSSRRTRK